ncbi:MAG: redox-sensitive transcriptional activator SoxR [Parvularculaceae bacterium]
MSDNDRMLSIGEAAKRSGLNASALRFYESEGLIRSVRSGGGRRWFARSELRRIAFIRAAQAAGLTLEEVKAALSALPDKRTPTKEDWERLSHGWRDLLDERIAALTRLRNSLSSCIGCGCLSLKVCRLYNPDDAAGALGAGPRYLLGDTAADVLTKS